MVPSARIMIPLEVHDAIRGEANRRLLQPGEVLTDFVRQCWPAYVAGSLARDLAPVIDVSARVRRDGLHLVESADEPQEPEP